MEIRNPFGGGYAPLQLPEGTMLVTMRHPERLADPAGAVRDALAHPIGCRPLVDMARERVSRKAGAKAVVVVSDNTRPVPYKGEGGILLPIIETLLEGGFAAGDILVLIATGTHRAMDGDEIRAMVDGRVLSMGVRVENHDCRDGGCLVSLGRTRRGTDVLIDRRYMEADLKVATGLVESHFMAGASGGRKAVCPGLVGERTTYVFHGPELMADPRSRDLNLEGNPVHEESLEVARMAGVDFLANVTLDGAFRITGVYFGDLEEAHLAAVAGIRKVVGVEEPHGSDVVVTNAGFVGVNHYQCAKCAVASLGILRKGGYLVIVADTTDKGNVVGGANYRKALALLSSEGPEGFLEAITGKGWTFLPEQWQVQQWAKVFRRIPMDHLYFYSPRITGDLYRGLPGIDATRFVQGKGADCFAEAVSGSLADIARREGRPLQTAYIVDGPYVIPHADDIKEES